MKTVAISLLGTTLDRRSRGKAAWQRWRPTISLCQQDDLIIDRLELLYQPHHHTLAEQVTADLAKIAPETKVNLHSLSINDPWDFEHVYSQLYHFSRHYPFNLEEENYLIHITTGTHVAQICLYLLTETHYLPGKLIQTSPSPGPQSIPGQYQIIDLDLSKYDQIASRFQHEHQEGTTYLKQGIDTRNTQFNQTIEQLEKISILSQEPIFLIGPSGSGKSQLARRIYELKKQRHQISGRFVVVNCATLQGDYALASLFGHAQNTFVTGKPRHGFLKEADNGILFLDEITALGNREQAMLLHALEEKQFMPYGADREVRSNFQLIVSTHLDVTRALQQGDLREDLWARINLWTYHLPALQQRPEDIAPNIDFELRKLTKQLGYMVSFNRQAKEIYLTFAKSAVALWCANFRDLGASITRMAILADGGRIDESIVTAETSRLRAYWKMTSHAFSNPTYITEKILGPEKTTQLDFFDHIQIAGIATVCRNSPSMADAGRKLFNVSRTQKKSSNDSHRLKQILQKYDLRFEDIVSLSRD